MNLQEYKQRIKIINSINFGKNILKIIIQNKINMRSNNIKGKEKKVLNKVKTERYSYKHNEIKNISNNNKQIIKSFKQLSNKQTFSKSKQKNKRSLYSNNYSQSMKIIQDSSKINSKKQSQRINNIKNKFTNLPNIPKDKKFQLKVSKQKRQVNKYDKLLNLKPNQFNLNNKKKYCYQYKLNSYQQKLNLKEKSSRINNQLTQRSYNNHIKDTKINLQSTNFQNYQAANHKQTDKQNLIHKIISQINKSNQHKQNKLTNQTKRKRIQSCKFVRNPFDNKKFKNKKLFKPQFIDMQHKLSSQQFFKQLQIQQISSIFQQPQVQNIPLNSQSIEILYILNQQGSFIA